MLSCPNTPLILHRRTKHDGKGNVIHLASIQPIFATGQFKRYMHVSNADLQLTPPPSTFNLAVKEDKHISVQERIKAFLSKNAEIIWTWRAFSHTLSTFSRVTG